MYRRSKTAPHRAWVETVGITKPETQPMQALGRLFDGRRFKLADFYLLVAKGKARKHRLHTDLIPVPLHGNNWLAGGKKHCFLGQLFTLFVYLSEGCEEKPLGNLRDGNQYVHTPTLGEGSWCIMDGGYPHEVQPNQTDENRFVLCLTFTRIGIAKAIMSQVTRDYVVVKKK